MHICVLGAGGAGLASARQALDPRYGHTCTIFEQAGEVGGTWVYTEATGNDEFGYPVHSSMYKHLRTNLPKEVMGYPDFEIPSCDKSYIAQEQMLQFLNSYADNYNLRSCVQFHHRVKYIEPALNDRWRVTVTALKESRDYIYEFDAVMICNGHYHTPSLPHIAGRDLFKGLQIHSHDFRDAEEYRGRNVLVIGAGPSGMDIALQVSRTAKQVIMSHHCKDEIATVFPDNLTQQPDVRYITRSGVTFNNDARAHVDVIIYCTGYLYSFPFLGKECGVCVDDNHVKPLYKQLINVHHPTMCFVGLPFYVCAFSMFDLQARFFYECLSGNLRLGGPEDMLRQTEDDVKVLAAEGFSKKHAHMLGPKQGAYFDELSSLAKLKPIPAVMTKLHNESSRRFLEDLIHFREDVYRIVDDDHFEQLQ